MYAQQVPLHMSLLKFIQIGMRIVNPQKNAYLTTGSGSKLFSIPVDDASRLFHLAGFHLAIVVYFSAKNLTEIANDWKNLIKSNLANIFPKVSQWKFTTSPVLAEWDILSHYENTPIQIYRKFHLQKLKIFR